MNTIHSYTLGIVSAVLGLIVLASIPFGRIRTRLRNATRRAFGIEAFETLMLDELRQQSQRTSSLEFVRHDGEQLRRQMNNRGDALSAHGTRVNRLKREVEEMGMLLHAYTETLGPIWNTAQGHRMPMRLLSTPHLKNIVDGGFGGYDARQFAMTELERRRIDADWREKEARGEKAPTLTDISFAAHQRQAAPFVRKTIVLETGTQLRVRNFLPQWAQKIVLELRTRARTSIKRDEQTRINRTLPVWARNLIADLARQSN